MIDQQQACPSCHKPFVLKSQGDEINAQKGSYYCGVCRTRWETEGERGLCALASGHQVIGFVLRTLENNPTASALELDQELQSGKISVLSFESPVIEIRRDAQLLRDGDRAQLNFQERHIPILAELAELMEQRRIKWLEAAQKSQPEHLDGEEDDEHDGHSPRPKKSGPRKDHSHKRSAIQEMRLLERYSSGEYEHVWKQMIELGSTVREVSVFSEVKPVVDETMKRVRKNAELLHQRLRQIEFQFGDPDFDVAGPPVEFPPANVLDELELIERKIGLLPLSLRCFCEHVGSLRFFGRHADISCDSQASLIVETLDMIWEEFDSWESNWEKDGEPFGVPIARDFTFAGMPPSIAVPNDTVDGVIRPFGLNFVDYLRDAFFWGGFPGMKEKHTNPPPIILRLTEGMLEF